MIVAKNLCVKIGERLLLDNVSTQIPVAKVTAILGQNGAGKSTLLKCLTGAMQFQVGSISINNQSIQAYSLAALSKTRAVLSQSTAIDFPFTAFEIVKMGRNPYSNNTTSGRDDEIALRALQSLDCLALKNRVFPTLSGGEQQRVQLARVIAQLWDTENTYLFLDEPTSALDLKHQHQVLSLMRKLAISNNIAVCMVMHDLNLALRYADQVLLMKAGRLEAAGKTNEVLTSNNIERVFDISLDAILFNKWLFH